MTAYYNEIEPSAAHILRAMIDADVIAPGDVDTRSIKEVSPDDLAGYTQCHFFAGGGFWSIAARLAGWPDDRPLWTGSCPCQPFSAAGKGLGTDDPRHLWPDFHRLIRARRPAVVMGEQVAGKAGRGWFDGVGADLEGDGFAARTVDFPACSVDAPHQRNRMYWVAVNVADSDRSGSTEVGRDVGEIRRLSEAERRTEHDAFVFRRGNGAAIERLSGSQQPGALDHCIGAGLEGHTGYGDGSGRQKPRGSVAEADGAEREHVADRAVESLLSGRPGKARCPQDANAGEARTLSGRELADTDGRSLHADAVRLGRYACRKDDTEHDRTVTSPAHEVRRRNGTYWSDADWIECHDGKARRAQSGIRFLVDGLPGRVDLWRVGGNAIVPQAAAEVIAAFMDVYGVPAAERRAVV